MTATTKLLVTLGGATLLVVVLVFATGSGGADQPGDALEVASFNGAPAPDTGQQRTEKEIDPGESADRPPDGESDATTETEPPEGEKPDRRSDPGARAGGGLLDQTITFDLTEVDLRTCADFIARVTQVNIVVDPALHASGTAEAEITLKVDGLPLQATLDLLTGLTGTKWEFRPPRLVFITGE